MNFSSCIFNSFELLLETVGNLERDITVILPVKEHFKDSSFDACKSCTTEENVVSVNDFLSEEISVIISDLIMGTDEFNELVRAIIKDFIDLKFIEFGLGTLSKQFFRLYLTDCVSGGVWLWLEN